MSLPADQRIVEAFTREDVENEAEKLATKVRYGNSHQVDTPEDANKKDDAWYNVDDKTIDFSRMKVTNFKYNGRLYPPRVGRRHDEVLVERMKEDYIKTGLEYIKTQPKKPINLTEEEYRGMKKLRKRVRNKEQVITNSDKSKKTVIVTFDLYMKCAGKHTVKDKVIDRKLVKKIERQANHQTKMFCMIMNIGTDGTDKEQ